eukprot:4024889-Prymnesium_polylepis.1
MPGTGVALLADTLAEAAKPVEGSMWVGEEAVEGGQSGDAATHIRASTSALEQPSLLLRMRKALTRDLGRVPAAWEAMLAELGELEARVVAGGQTASDPYFGDLSRVRCAGGVALDDDAGPNM